MPCGRADARPLDEERSPDAAKAGGQLPPQQLAVGHQVPQAAQLRQGRHRRPEEGLRGGERGRPGLEQRQGHQMGHEQRTEGTTFFKRNKSP